MRKLDFGMLLAGAAAGAVTGLFGAGGGMVLIPLLTLLTDLADQELFASSIAVILPVCLVCLFFSRETLLWKEALPYLIGSGLGGFLAGIFGRKIPVSWLHKGLGLLILWGGWRYLWG